MRICGLLLHHLHRPKRFGERVLKNGRVWIFCANRSPKFGSKKLVPESSWSPGHPMAFFFTPRARLQATVLIQTFGQIFEAAVQKGPLTFCLDSADATTHGERDVTLPPMLPPSEGFAGFIPPLFQSYSGLLFPIFHVPSGSIRFHPF